MVELAPKFWRELGGKIAKWVRSDFEAGLFQNNMQGDHYRSRQYMKYKANDMRRFTVGEGQTFSDKEGYFFGETHFRSKKAGYSKKKQMGTGKRLKAYYGRTIASRETGFVNMILTGRLMKGLKPRKWDNYSVTMGYESVDAGKILGGQKYSREVMGLNTENRDLVKQEIIKEFDRNQIEWGNEPINIYIKY